MVRCADGTFYTGYTTDIPKRIDTHNKGKGAKYTKGRLPVTLVWCCEYKSKSEALKEEYLIKHLPYRRKKHLIQVAMSGQINNCVFCGFLTWTRGHHIIPKCKGGTETVPSCQTCEDYIHKTWSHNELRDIYNNVETIIANEGFQKFLKWRRKQSPDTLFKSDTGKTRDKGKFK
jgi:putative endonuclease